MRLQDTQQQNHPNGYVGFSYPRRLRITNSKLYTSVYKTPYKASIAGIVVYAKPNKLVISRLGMAIPKRQLAEASKRNLVKRIIRESFRHNQQRIAGLDIIVTLKGKDGVLSKRQLRETVENLWEKLLILCKGHVNLASAPIR